MSAADHLPFQLLILATDTTQVERTVRALVEPAGHPVASVHVVGIGELRGALNEALDAGGVVLICGGTHREAQPAMRRLRGVVDDELPGFAELFRVAAFQHIGAAAMFTDAHAGFTTEGVPIFAVPGPAGAVKIALAELILPGLHALQPGALLGWPHPHEDPEHEAASAEAAARMARAHGLLPPEEAEPEDEPTEAEPTPPPTLQQRWKLQEAPPSDRGDGEVGEGWRAALRAFAADFLKHEHPFLPDPFQAMVKAREALDLAGEKAVMRLPDGRSYGLFGYPDLRGSRSRVLAVGPGEPLPEIIALHHFPEQVGTCIFGEAGFLPSADLDPNPHSEERTGFALNQWGRLAGLGVHTVYVERGGRLVSWNGMRERDKGTLAQGLAQLLTEWSRR